MKKKTYTQAEYDLAVRHARRLGVEEGREKQRRSVQRVKELDKFGEECEKILQESIEEIRHFYARKGVAKTQGDVLKSAAIKAIWKTRLRLGERP